MKGSITPLPQFGAPRCSWLQRMIDREDAAREKENAVRCTRLELQNLRTHTMRQGYDPYNSADLTPGWLRVVPPDAIEPVKFRRDYR